MWTRSSPTTNLNTNTISNVSDDDTIASQPHPSTHNPSTPQPKPTQLLIHAASLPHASTPTNISIPRIPQQTTHTSTQREASSSRKRSSISVKQSITELQRILPLLIKSTTSQESKENQESSEEEASPSDKKQKSNSSKQTLAPWLYEEEISNEDVLFSTIKHIQKLNQLVGKMMLNRNNKFSNITNEESIFVFDMISNELSTKLTFSNTDNFWAKYANLQQLADKGGNMNQAMMLPLLAINFMSIGNFNLPKAVDHLQAFSAKFNVNKAVHLLPFKNAEEWDWGSSGWYANLCNLKQISQMGVPWNELQAYVIFIKAFCAALQGKYIAAVHYYYEGVKYANQMNHVALMAVMKTCEGAMRFWLGDGTGNSCSIPPEYCIDGSAIFVGPVGVQLPPTHWIRLKDLFISGWNLCSLGNTQLGIAMMEVSRVEIDRMFTGIFIDNVTDTTIMVSAYLWANRVDDAANTAKKCLTIVNKADMRSACYAELIRLYGEALMRQGHIIEAYTYFMEALSVAKESGVIIHEARCYISLGRLCINLYTNVYDGSLDAKTLEKYLDIASNIHNIENMYDKILELDYFEEPVLILPANPLLLQLKAVLDTLKSI